MLWLAQISPQVVVQDVEQTIVAPEITRLRLKIENTGYLPTNITQRALEVQVARPVRVLLELRDAELISGKTRTNLGHLPGRRDSASTARSVEYVLRKMGPQAAVLITVESEKGGTSRLAPLTLP